MHALTVIVDPSLDRSTQSVPSSAVPGMDGSGPLPRSFVRVALKHRHFRMLTPHTILKSFHQPDAFAATRSQRRRCHLQGVSDLRQVGELPIWLVSNPSVQVSTCPRTPSLPCALHLFILPQWLASCAQVLFLPLWLVHSMVDTLPLSGVTRTHVPADSGAEVRCMAMVAQCAGCAQHCRAPRRRWRWQNSGAHRHAAGVECLHRRAPIHAPRGGDADGVPAPLGHPLERAHEARTLAARRHEDVCTRLARWR